jgi:hypothetical protein
MESWYEVTTKDTSVGERFGPIWMAHGGPKDAAVFGVHDFKAKTTHFYFNPGAARIGLDFILDHGGVVCPQPHNWRSLQLVVGDQSIIESNG